MRKGKGGTYVGVVLVDHGEALLDADLCAVEVEGGVGADEGDFGEELGEGVVEGDAYLFLIIIGEEF